MVPAGGAAPAGVMKIGALTSALQDLAEGRRFYDQQGEGLGDCFLNSLFSDADALAFDGAFTERSSVSADLSPADSPVPFTINSTPTGERWLTACSIAAKNQPRHRPR